MTTARSSDLSQRIGEVLAIDHTAPVIEFGGTWRTWGQLAEVVDQVAALIDRPGTEVGIVLRNRPAAIGVLLGVLQAGGCVVTINPGRGRDRTRDDIAALDLPIIAGYPDDLAELVADGARATTISMTDLGEPLVVRTGSDPTPGVGRPGVAVRMLTSGTTGPPKRIDLSYETLGRVLVDAKHYESSRGAATNGNSATRQLRRGVAVVNSPLVHLGGLFRVLQCVTDGRSFALLEKFEVERWVDVVRRHRPATASLVPAALRMVLEADLDPQDLASLRSVVSGTAPLDPDDADAFIEKYGAPVLISYAATEFGGAVAGWTIHDHREFWATKRGSVGRAHTGCRLRIVDAETGADVAPGVTGLLEVKASQLVGQDWIRTTDLSRIDEDGFLWIIGRADQAIIRGGFKVIPDDVRLALERHPAVRGASVVARDDQRLGAVPVAAVELSRGAGPVHADELAEFVSNHLARYELPAEIRIVDELPRTDSGKVDLGAVSALMSDPSAEA